MKSILIQDLLSAMFKKYGKVPVKQIGLQRGENLHEKIMEDGKYSNEVLSYTPDEIEKMI